MNQNSLSGLTRPPWHPVEAPGLVPLKAVLDAVNTNDQTLRRTQAEHLRLLDQARRNALAEVDGEISATPTASAKLVLERGFALRSLIAELATMLHLPEATILGQLYEAQHLTEQLPATLAALDAGHISLAHVREITREAVAVAPETVSLFEEAALPLAARLTVPRFRLALRRLTETMNPDALTERIRRNRSERRVHIESDRDGMA